MNYTIVIFPKIQVDTAVSCFLLKQFGEKKFAGIKNAEVEFWTELPEGKTADELEQDGYILVDLGLSRFDHHRLGPNNKKVSSAHLVADYLQINNRPDLQKLLELARRDDLEGRGTISNDPIDRAFGLSGLLTNLNKGMPDKSAEILEIVLLLIKAHYLEENRRHETLPKEYKQLLANGKIREFKAAQFGKQLKIIHLQSDNPALVGFVRSRAVGAHLVIQVSPSSHINFITQQAKQLELKKLARLVKLLEAEKNNLILNIDSESELELPGRTNGLPHWYYDTRANTLQNGGVNPKNIPPSKLNYEELEYLVKEGLNIEHPKPRPKNNKHKITKGKGVIYID